MVTRLRFIALLLALVLVPASMHAQVRSMLRRVTASKAPVNPSSALLYPNNLTYAGAFKLPTTHPGATNGFDHVSQGFAFNPPNGGNGTLGSFYIVNHINEMKVAELQIPTLTTATTWASLGSGNTATFLQNFFDAAEGNLTHCGTGGATVIDAQYYGLMVYNSKLVAGVSDSFSTGCRLTHFYHTPSLTSGGFNGQYQVGNGSGAAGQGPRMIGGYMTTIPSAWQARLGGPALTGNCCLSIIASTSAGAAMSVFDPDQLGVSSPVAAAPLVFYDSAHTSLNTGTNLGPTPYFTDSMVLQGIIFPDGSDTVMVFGTQSTGGEACYGETQTDPTKARQTATTIDARFDYCFDYPGAGVKGPSDYPYKNIIWFYDANDFYQVKLGNKNAWNVYPYATWTLDLPFVNNDTGQVVGIAGVAWDATNSRIYVAAKAASQDGLNQPVIYALNVNLGTTPVAEPARLPMVEMTTTGWTTDNHRYYFPVSAGCKSLQWQESDGTSVSIDNGIGVIATPSTPAAQGTQTVCPGSTTTYTMTVTNAVGSTTSSKVTVIVGEASSNFAGGACVNGAIVGGLQTGSCTTFPSAYLSPSVYKIVSGGHVNLNWTTANATSMEIWGGGSQIIAGTNNVGSVQVAPTHTTQYVLTAYGNNGSIMNWNTVVFVTNTMLFTLPEVQYATTLSDVASGTGTTLTWSCNNISGNVTITTQGNFSCASGSRVVNSMSSNNPFRLQATSTDGILGTWYAPVVVH